MLTMSALLAFAQDFSYTYEGQTVNYTVIDETQRTCQTKAGEGYGSNWTASNNVSGVLVLPDHPKDGDKEYTLVAIGQYSFCDNSGLTSLTLPESLEYIKIGAFNGCNNLKELTYNAIYCGAAYKTYELTVFPASLEKVTFGKNVSYIPGYLLYGNTKIKSLIIPDAVETIGELAFSECTGVTSMYIGKSVDWIEYGALSCRNLENVTYNAIACRISGELPSSVKKISIGPDVRYIPDGLFYECRKMEEVNAESLEQWLDITFESQRANPLYCAKNLKINGQNIRRLVIPEGTKQINNYAFYNCGILTATIPSSVRQFGKSVFGGCSDLQKITYPSLEDYLSLTYDSEECLPTEGNNSQIYIGDKSLDELLGIPNLVIPSSVTRIPDYAFWGNSRIQTVTIPSTVTEIGKYAFGECAALSSADLPETIKKINEGTFIKCKNLRNATIPASVDSILEKAFAGCTGMQRVTLKGNVKFFGNNAFGKPDKESDESLASIECVDIPDIKGWCKAEFTGPYSNPIAAAKKLCISGEEITSLDIDLPGEDISPCAFADLKGVERININARNIGNSAFIRAKNLKKVILTADSLGELAFYDAQNISEAEIAIKEIGRYAFEQCRQLKNITFTETPHSIGNGAFKYVPISIIEIPSLNRWALVNFGNESSNPLNFSSKYTLTVNGVAPKHLVLDIGNNKVSPYAFTNAKQFESVMVKAAGIGASAFENCQIKNLCIDVESIDEKAFAWNWDISSIYSITSVPPVAEDNVFDNYKGIDLYVPAGSVSLYGNADNCWWHFLDIYESDFSDLSTIFGRDYEDTGISNIVTDTAFTLITNGRSVTLLGAENTDVRIYSMSGMQIYEGRGCEHISLDPGVYILTASTFTSKFILK